MTKSKTRKVIEDVDKNPEKYGTTAKKVKEINDCIAVADGTKPPRKKKGKKKAEKLGQQNDYIEGSG